MGGYGDDVFEKNSLSGNTIQIGRGIFRVSVTPYVVGAKCVLQDEEDFHESAESDRLS